jgi:hypothetical protein
VWKIIKTIFRYVVLSIGTLGLLILGIGGLIALCLMTIGAWVSQPLYTAVISAIAIIIMCMAYTIREAVKDE